MNNEKEYKYGYVWDNDYGNIVVEFFYPEKAKEWYNYEMSIYHEPYLYTTDEELINLIGKMQRNDTISPSQRKSGKKRVSTYGSTNPL